MVAPHNLAIDPVLGGISGSTSTILRGLDLMQMVYIEEMNRLTQTAVYTHSLIISTLLLNLCHK